MKNQKTIILAALLSAYTLQIPSLFAGNTTSGAEVSTSFAYPTCTPRPLVTTAISLALVEWKQPFHHLFQHDTGTSEATIPELYEIPTDPTSQAPYIAYLDHSTAMEDLRKNFELFVAEQYNKGNITKKRVKQVIKGANQKAITKGKLPKKGECVNPDLVPFFQFILDQKCDVNAEIKRYANATCLVKPLKRR